METVIRPALAAGHIVICDRFSGSTFAYQLGARGLEDADMVTAMDAYARAGISPDLVMYLDIDPVVGLQRKRESDEAMNRLDNEALAFHQRVRAHFLEQAKDQANWVTYSTDGAKDTNSQNILAAVRSQLHL